MYEYIYIIDIMQCEGLLRIILSRLLNYIYKLLN